MTITKTQSLFTSICTISILCILCICLTSARTNASTSASTSNLNFAKIALAKGEVLGTNPGGSNSRPLKQGDELIKETTITTGDKSFAKIVYNDNTQVNIGPKGQIVLHEIKKNEPGIISAIKGQIQTTVTKQSDPNAKDKLYINTPSAAMGVRGTSFIVVVNGATEGTSVVTLEGSVKMVATKAGEEASPSPIYLSQLLSSDKAVSLNEGQFSASAKGQEEVTPPLKISPSQLDALKNNTKGEFTREEKSQKRVGSSIPPNVSAKSFVNQKSQEIVKAEAAKTEVSKSEVVKTEVAKTEIAKTEIVKTEVAKNESSKAESVVVEVAKKPDEKPSMAGGFIDLGTGAYIPPPPNSVFDENTGVFIPPASVGNLDLTTGAYIPPAGIDLNEKGEFVIVETETVKKEDTNTISSISATTVTTTPVTIPTVMNTQNISLLATQEMAPPKIQESQELTIAQNETIVENMQEKIGNSVQDTQQSSIEAISGNSQVQISIRAE